MSRRRIINKMSRRRIINKIRKNSIRAGKKTKTQRKYERMRNIRGGSMAGSKSKPVLKSCAICRMDIDSGKNGETYYTGLHGQPGTMCAKCGDQIIADYKRVFPGEGAMLPFVQHFPRTKSAEKHTFKAENKLWQNKTAAYMKSFTNAQKKNAATVPKEVWITPFATTEEAVRAAEAHGQEQLPESDSESEEEEKEKEREKKITRKKQNAKRR